MSLTGILLDVSGSMKSSIGSGTDEQGGPWAQSIFKVIDDLIEHDLTSENRVFGIGVGTSCTTQIFDVIGTLKQIQNFEMWNDGRRMRTTRATKESVDKIFEILRGNGARNIHHWVKNITFIQDELSENLAALVWKELRSNEEFLKKFVYEFLPSICRDNQCVQMVDKVPILGAVSKWGENMAAKQCSNYVRSARREEVQDVVEKAKRYIFKDVEIADRHFFKKVEDHSIFSVQDASRIIRGCVDENELTTQRSKELLENVEPFIYGGTPLYESLEKATKYFKERTLKTKCFLCCQMAILQTAVIKTTPRSSKLPQN